MRYATFNVLADAYIGYGDYSRVEPELLGTGARTQKLVQLVDSLEADVVGLQEVEVKDYLKDNVKENMVCQYFCNKLKEGLTEEEIFNNLKEIINNKKTSAIKH